MSAWTAFELELPSAAAATFDVSGDGRPRIALEVHRDAETLTVLSDALRAAVVDVDAQRAVLAVERGQS
jgi:hypothetical protein